MFRILLVALALFTFTGWTNEKVRVVVPVAAGNSQDVKARKIVEQLTLQTGKTFYVENKPGASTTIGTRYFLNADPKTSLLITNSVLISSLNTIKNVDYNIQEDLELLAVVSSTPLVFTTRGDIKGPKEFRELGLAGKLKYAQVGYGGASHYASLDLLKTLEIDATAVSYKSSGEAIADILAGRIDFMFMPLDLVSQHIMEGKLTNTSHFSPIIYWSGVFVNKNAPEEMKKELRAELAKMRSNQQFVAAMGADTLIYGGEQKPEDLEAFMDAQVNFWYQLSQRLEIKKN
jgi:tripartite-type tricarboxylate transporter receptor subunit TctC